MEELIGDADTFNEKVLGAFVRIRISGTGQRQDIYRLVQIVGKMVHFHNSCQIQLFMGLIAEFFFICAQGLEQLLRSINVGKRQLT